MTISKSFQDLHDELYLKGIKDVGFLVYTNPSVKGLNPFSTELTLEEKISIRTEINKNFWYFLRDIVKCDVMGNEEPEHFRINRAALGSLWLANNNHSVYSVLPWGSSNVTCQAIWCLWKLIRDYNYYCKILDESEEEAKTFVERVKSINRNLPSFMRLEDECIEKRMKVPNNPKTLQQADVFGRGLTVDVFIINLENIKYIDVILKTIAPILACGKSKIYATSEIGEKGSYGKKVGDMISSKSIKWVDEMLDIDIKNKSQLIYNSMSMDYIKTYDEIEAIKKLFDYDHELIRRRIYMER